MRLKIQYDDESAKIQKIRKCENTQYRIQRDKVQVRFMMRQSVLLGGQGVNHRRGEYRSVILHRRVLLVADVLPGDGELPTYGQQAVVVPD